MSFDVVYLLPRCAAVVDCLCRYHAYDGANLAAVMRQVNDVKKKYNAKALEAIESNDADPALVEPLVLTRGGKGIPRLSELAIVPSPLPRQRKVGRLMFAKL